METIISLIGFCLSTLLISFLIFKVIKSATQIRQLIAICIQLEMDNNLLYAQLEEFKKENSTKELSENEGFVKFLSTSRDWAFNYIEQAQSALKNFDNTVEPILEWNKTYGTVIGDDLFSKKIEEISLAYEKLKSLLPKDNETPNN